MFGTFDNKHGYDEKGNMVITNIKVRGGVSVVDTWLPIRSVKLSTTWVL